MKTLPDSVKQLKDWPISGHLIPHTWYHHLTTKRGDPYGPAIFILADILYWYRPKVITDEKTGKVTYEKKFKKDLLQRSYEQMASKFSISKRQATQAVVYLEEKNLIKRVFRSIKLGDLVINNVLYIELNVEELFKISLPEDEIIDPLPSHRETLSPYIVRQIQRLPHRLLSRGRTRTPPPPNPPKKKNCFKIWRRRWRNNSNSKC